MSRDAPPHCLFFFPSFQMGGAQRRTLALANHWGARFRYSFAAVDQDFSGLAALDPAIRHDRLPFGLSKSSLLFPQRLGALRALLHRVRPDVLVTLNWGTIEMALANRWFPCVGQVHLEEGFGAEESPERQLRRRVWLRRLALSGCHQVTVVPSRTLHTLASERWGLRRLRYIPNGIDVARFAQAGVCRPGLRANLRRRPDEVVVGTLGGLRPEKNLPRLVRAIAALQGDPPARLVIVGEGPERARIEAAVAAAGLTEQVDFLGQVAAPESVYPLFDIFAMSSDTEQMPLSLMEAMACGLPVAATEVGDLRDMVSLENVEFLVAGAEDLELAKALDHLRRDADLRARLGAANRERASLRFDFRSMAEDHARLLDEISRKAYD